MSYDRPKDNSKFFAKNVKGFQPKDGAAEVPNAETEAAMQDVRDGKTTKGVPKVEAPKLPTAEVTPNATLKCQTASFNGLTWLGLKSAKGETFWRVTGTSRFQKIMTKAEAYRADASLTDQVKDAKVAEAVKSMSDPVVRLPFAATSEKGFDKTEKAAEAPTA